MIKNSSLESKIDLNNQLIIVLAVFFLGFVSFGFMGVNHILSGDDWKAIVEDDFADLISLKAGRWMHKIISDLSYNRLYSPLFSLSFLLISNLIVAFYVTKVIRIKEVFLSFIFMSLYICNPIWIEAYLFKMGHLPKAFSLLFSVASSHFAIKYLSISNKITKDIFLACLFLSFSAACYQSYSFVGVIITMLFILHKIIEGDKIQNSVLVKFILYVISGLILYYLLTWIVVLISNVKLYKEGSYSVIDVIGFSGFFTNSAIAFKRIFSFYINGDLLIPFWINCIFLLSYIATSLFLLNLKKISTRSKLIGIVLATSIFLLPWSLYFLKTGFVGRYNMMIPIAIVNASFFYFLVRFIYKFKYLEIFTSISFGCIIFYMVFFNSAASYSKFLSVEKDNNLTNTLISHIVSNSNYIPEKKYMLLFVGENPYESKDLSKPFNIMHNANNDNLVNHLSCGVWNCQLIRIPHHIFLQSEMDNITMGNKRSINYPEIISKIDTKQLGNWPSSRSVIINNQNNAIIVFFDKGAMR